MFLAPYRVTKSSLVERAIHLASCMMKDRQHGNKMVQCMCASFNECGLKGLSFEYFVVQVILLSIIFALQSCTFQIY